MYNSNHVIVIVFNCTRAYAQCYTLVTHKISTLLSKNKMSNPYPLKISHTYQGSQHVLSKFIFQYSQSISF